MKARGKNQAHRVCAIVFLGGHRSKRAEQREKRQEESHLKTEVTKGEGHEVTLKVEAGPEDLVEILEQTYKDLGKKLKIPGFRKGKIPRQVIDSHLGSEYVRTEAIKNGLPTLYVLGVIDAGINPVSDPQINCSRPARKAMSSSRPRWTSSLRSRSRTTRDSRSKPRTQR
jgi:hypothetical protein